MKPLGRIPVEGTLPGVAVIETGIDPAKWAGVTATTVNGSSTWKRAGWPSKETWLTLTKPAPWIWTWVPPAIGPLFGESQSTLTWPPAVGAGTDSVERKKLSR